jgi:protein-S-isoprenylcysteine O-methyltransferase Ste14
MARLIREMRYHEVSRQLLAVVLIALFAFTAAPLAILVQIGLPLAFIGMLIRFHASGYVLKNKELATQGPYALMRHPLYTGNIALVTGFALANSSYWAIPLALVFFAFYYPTAIEYEDRKLRAIFGERWRQWAGHTPALVPRLTRIGDLFRGSWSFALSTKKNGEIFFVIFALVCMVIVLRRLGTF